MNLKKKFLRKEKGITLIALVITIIVLLILAGVAISMLSGENSVINKTNSAKTETDISSEEESVKLAVMSALATGNGEIVSEDAFKILRDELKKAGCTNAQDIKELPAIARMKNNIYKIDKYGKLIEPTELDKMPEISFGVIASEKSKYVDEKGSVVVVPKGFKISSDSVKLVQEGIVVIAPDNSEFVWVPVENINSMVMCQSHAEDSECDIVKGENNKLKCKNHINSLICGKLYATSTGENFNENLNTQTYNADSGLREPAILSDTFSGDKATGFTNRGVAMLKDVIGLSGTNSEIITKWQEQLQEDFENMAINVYNYKGFYVGRYESSSNSGKIQSKKFTSPLKKSWYNLYQLQRNYSQDNNLTDIVGSGMIWGSQYDQMLLWLLKNEYNIKSNQSTDLKDAEANTSTNTGGYSSTDILNNIHDLLRGENITTMEASGDRDRTLRGGRKRFIFSKS